MLYTSAVFSHKNNNFEPRACIVEKVIRLSGEEYDSFARNMMRDQDFIHDNIDLMSNGPDGKRHCLLVCSDDRRDGILVESQGYDYARYAAFVPNVEGLLTVGQYPALASLARNMAEIVEYIVGEYGTSERSVVDLQDLETMFGYDLMSNGVLRDAVMDMLGDRSEVKDFELDKNELIIYGTPEPLAADLSDPTVTKTDMYAYGYHWDGMIPLGKERALTLHNEGHQIYRLYEDNTEGCAESRSDIEIFDGLFGIEDSAWEKNEQAQSFEVFILNRERYDKGEPAGEWLTLPANADTLRGLFERIGIDRPSDGAFTITAVRMPLYELLRNDVTKYDSLDELNMLASFWNDMEDFERSKVEAILVSGVQDIGRGTSALINALCEENFDAFRMIDATDFESLGRYWENEDHDKPEELSFEDYGKDIVADEKGKFTEHGYIYFRYKDLLPEYTGVVPDEYKIVGAALQCIRTKATERGGDSEKPSVVEKIRAARSAPRVPKNKDAQKLKKSKEGQDL